MTREMELKPKENQMMNGNAQVQDEKVLNPIARFNESPALRVNIYTVGAKLVKSAPLGMAPAQWNEMGIKKGVYIAAVEAQDMNGEVVKRQSAKLLVIC
jgi:hypothetical protein